jgi:hypothetical protein
MAVVRSRAAARARRHGRRFDLHRAVLRRRRLRECIEGRRARQDPSQVHHARREDHRRAAGLGSLLVDLFRGGAPVDWEHLRPKPSSSHEVKYQTNLITEGDSILPFFVAYLARKWDRAHPKRPVAAIDIVEVMRPKGSFRRKLLWHREFSPTVIPDLNHDWHAKAFKVHEEGRVQIVLASPDLTERVCKTKKSVAGLSCNADTEDQLLRPFTRIEGTPFLAPAEPLAAFVEGKAPFAVECSLKIVGKTPKPKVRFDRDTPWFETTDDWAVGELSACSPLPSFDGPSMAKESPEQPEKNTSPKRKSKEKKLKAKKKKKARCPTEPCEP